VVLYSSDGGATFADVSAAVAAAAEPAARAAAERHRQLEAQHPGRAPLHHHTHASNKKEGSRGPLPLFIHGAAVLALQDGQVLFNADPDAAPEAWHAVCQLPGPVVALASDDGLSSPSAKLQA
jgi:hypothetical protein